MDREEEGGRGRGNSLAYIEMEHGYEMSCWVLS